MTPRLRKLTLTAHVASSVGWLGAVVAFLALALTAVTSQDAGLVRSVYRTAEPLTWFVILPLALASLLTGIVQSLGSRWGLFRHYWVVAKLLINVAATVVLLLYTRTVGSFADIAAAPNGDLAGLRGASFVLHSGAAAALLLTATALAVYKPPGMTRYGRRKASEQAAASEAAR